jgi:uncharacterized repeat protein (TIGR01451 family)
MNAHTPIGRLAAVVSSAIRTLTKRHRRQAVPVRQVVTPRGGARPRYRRNHLLLAAVMCIGAAGALTSSAQAVNGTILSFNNTGTDPVVAGTLQQVKLTLTLFNTDPFNAGTVVVNVPANGVVTGVTLGSHLASLGTYDGTDWTVDLPASGMATLLLRLNVASNAPAGSHELIAEVTSGGPAGMVAGNFSIVRQVDIALFKSESTDPVVAGTGLNNLSYTITAVNNGPSDASGIVILEDLTLPPCVVFSGFATGGTQPSLFVAGAPPTTPPDGLWDIPVLPVGESVTLTVLLTANSCAADGAMVENTAYLFDLNELPDTNGFNNAVNEDTAVTRIVNLEVLKTDNVDPVVAGSGNGAVNLSYGLTVINHGPSDASGVEVFDIPMLPADVTLVPPVVVSPGTMMVGTDRWLVGNVVADSTPANPPTMTRNIVVGPSAVPGSDVIENAAVIDEYNEPDSDLGNNGTTEYTSIITMADVDVTKTHDPDPVIAGTEMVITIAVTNNGPSDAQNVVVTDVLPVEVTYLSDTCGGTFDGTTFTWMIGTLGDEESVSCDITVFVNADVTTDFDNTTEVAWQDNPNAGAPGTPVDESDASPVDPVQVITEADLSITKLDDPDPVVADTVLTYTIEVTNAGPSDAQNVHVNDVLPAELIFQATVGCVNDPNGVPDCDLDVIPAGQSKVYTITALVDAWASGMITNCAQVTSDTVDPNPGEEEACEDTQIIAIDKPAVGGKGSLLIWSKVDIRWDAAGFLTQDTFISLTNDFPGDVDVQMYFINGDPPLDADGAERAHPGWNWLDNRITLTGDQPTYWSAVTGQPATGGGISPFTALDPGFPPGRPDPSTGGRMMRGYIIGFATDEDNVPVKWNQLTGNGTIVNYLEGSAWEYNTYSIRILNDDLPHGRPITDLGVAPDELPMNGIVYGRLFNRLFFNFQAAGSSAFSGPRTVTSDTSLTLYPVGADLRQETDGPVTTKATFEVWNMNEVKFTGLHRCITCWDQTLLSDYNFPNHFLIQNLQTDHGTARIDGKQSQVCDVDYDPGNNWQFPFPPGPDDPVDPRDLVSQDAALLGVAARLLRFDGGADQDSSGYTLIGTGADGSAVIKFDGQDPFEEAVIDEIDLDLPLLPTVEEIEHFVDSVMKVIRK